MKEQIDLNAPCQGGEQTEVCPTEERASKAQEENSYGKFASLRDLIAGYNNLEREFTKRSQKLKELENAVAGNVAGGRISEEAEGIPPLPARLKAELADRVSRNSDTGNNGDIKDILISLLLEHYKTPEQYASDENFLKTHVLGNEFVKNAVIRSYLDDISRARAPGIIGGGGQSAVSLPSRPKNLKEAADLAEKIFK